MGAARRPGSAGTGRRPGRGRLAFTRRRRPGGRTAGPSLRLPERRCPYRTGRRPGGPVPARWPEPAYSGDARRRDAAGALTSESRRLRRLLAARLLSDERDGLAVHQLIWGWEPSRAAQERDAEQVRRGRHPSLASRLGLLGPPDLRWALETAEAAGPGDAATCTAVLSGIWDQQDQDAQDAAWQVRDTPLWAAFCASFNPVVLGSDDEEMQRNLFDAMRPRPPGRVGGRGRARRRGP
jgi:hypothetical protein